MTFSPPDNFNKLKVAIVYDWLTTQRGGAELVIKSLTRAFPNADLLTSIYDSQTLKTLGISKIKASFLQLFSFVKNFKSVLTPIFPLAFESLDFSGYNIVISVTSSFAKGVITQPGQLHLSYVFTSTRFLHSHKNRYFERYHRLVRFLMKPIIYYLTIWDLIAAKRPDKIMTISKLSAQRLLKYYNINNVEVLYPPVPKAAVSAKIPSPDFNYLLSLSRLVKYKRIDLSIKTALLSLNNLLIVGMGPEKVILKKLTQDSHLSRKNGETLARFIGRFNRQLSSELPKTIGFVGACSEEEKTWLIKHAKALLAPGIEDFGITAMEAAILGTPVILPKQSGAAELLDDMKSAVYSKDESYQHLLEAVNKLNKLTPERSKLRMTATQFSELEFEQNFRNKVQALWKEHHDIGT